MKKFLFKMYSLIDIELGRITIEAKNYDVARKLFFAKDLPYHHHSTVEIVK